MKGRVHPIPGYFSPISARRRGQAVGNHYDAQDHHPPPEIEPSLSQDPDGQAPSGRRVRTRTDEVALINELFPPGPFNTQ